MKSPHGGDGYPHLPKAMKSLGYFTTQQTAWGKLIRGVEPQ